mgnify:CR=1 FL=1
MDDDDDTFEEIQMKLQESTESICEEIKTTLGVEFINPPEYVDTYQRATDMTYEFGYCFTRESIRDCST